MLGDYLLQFNADKLEGFLISNSLVGIGLVIAIYAFMSPILKILFEKRKKILGDLIVNRDETLKKIDKDKDNQALTTQLKKLQKKIKSFKRIPIHLDSGYQITTVLFSYSLFFSVIRIITLDTGRVSLPILQILGSMAFLFFCLGVILFVLFFLLLLGDVRENVIEEFQKIIDREEKGEDKVEKHLKDIKDTLKNAEKREKERDDNERMERILKPIRLSEPS